MTQDSDRQPSSSTKRSARAGRNRPVLVTSQDGEGNELTGVEEKTPTIEESVAEVEAQNPPVASPRRRMPAFFSTIGSVRKQKKSRRRLIRRKRGSRVRHAARLLLQRRRARTTLSRS